MRVLLIEPYYGGSHRAWADGYARHSAHDITLLTLPAQNWKWRMRGGAITLARRYREQNAAYDLILASDMMDVALFRALAQPREPLALYFHENQLTYPQNERQSHGWQYGFINYASALSADAVFFNSAYHQRAFFAEAWRMLRHARDHNELASLDALKERTSVLPLGLDLRAFDAYADLSRPDGPPILLWNHRWEADKQPDLFFQALAELQEAGYAFRVVLAGENVRQEPSEFLRGRARLGERVLHFGYVPSFAAYARWLWRADFVISTAVQEFFGIAVTQAMYCRCVPLLPERLNYPDLLPETFHRACLYRRDKLAALLRQHLDGALSVEASALREAVAVYDWSHMAPRYDAALAALV